MASTDVQSQISALRAEIATLQKDLSDRGSEAYESIRDRAGIYDLAGSFGAFARRG